MVFTSLKDGDLDIYTMNVDGSNVQENLRGQARPLFIEDAIQETTVMSAGVSAA